MEEGWVKWKLKHERPEKVPSCQDTSQLHRLEPGETDCLDQKCFYYTCQTCPAELALDIFNPNYKEDLHVIPRLSCIKQPDLFTEDSDIYHGYHGEVIEFYANCLERSNFKGIAVNGWSNVYARKLYDNVEATFEQRNQSKTKPLSAALEEDFENKRTKSSTAKSKNNSVNPQVCHEKNLNSAQNKQTKTKQLLDLKKDLGCKMTRWNKYIKDKLNKQPPLSRSYNEKGLKPERGSDSKIAMEKSKEDRESQGEKEAGNASTKLNKIREIKRSNSLPGYLKPEITETKHAKSKAVQRNQSKAQPSSAALEEDPRNKITETKHSKSEDRKIMKTSEGKATSESRKEVKDFEIDWILFDGTSITVVEVGEEGEEEPEKKKGKDKNCKKKQQLGKDKKGNDSKDCEVKKHSIVVKKLEQIKRDVIVIRHLLEATSASDVPVNYLAMFPNLTVEEIEAALEGSGFLRRNSETSFSVGIVSSDSMTRREMHALSLRGEQPLWQSVGFLDFPSSSRSCEKWSPAYKHVTASVVLSILTTEKAAVEENLLVERSFQLEARINQKQRSEARSALKYTKTMRNVKFPSNLILGPEQLSAINSRERITWLIGDAGSGKTMVLLALLVKYAGKHLDYSDIHRILFVIPDKKLAFKQRVQQFVNEFCYSDCVTVASMTRFQQEKKAGYQLLLVDEIYNNRYMQDIVDVYALHNILLIYCAVVNGSRVNIHAKENIEQEVIDIPSIIPTEGSMMLKSEQINRVYLRSLHRNPFQISRVSSKLRFSLDEEPISSDYISSLPWAMSVNNGTNVRRAQDSIRLFPYQESILECWKEAKMDELPQSMLEKTALIKIECDLTSLPGCEKCPSFSVTDLDNVSSEQLEFTGVEYTDIWVIFSKIRQNAKKSAKVELLLHHAISRVTNSVVIAYHERDHDVIGDLVAFSDEDLLLEKLSRNMNVTTHELDKLQLQTKVIQALRIIVFNKNMNQFKEMLKSLVEGSLRKWADRDFYQRVQEMLATSFPWCEKGKILDMLELFLAKTQTEMTTERSWTCLKKSVMLVRTDWNHDVRRNLFQKFKQVTNISTQSIKFNNELEKVSDIEIIWIAEDEHLINAFRNPTGVTHILLFLISAAKYHFNENCFQELINSLCEGRRDDLLCIPRDDLLLCFYLGTFSREDNFRILVENVKADIVTLFTKVLLDNNEKLFLEYASTAFTGVFREVMRHLSNEQIALSSILDSKGRNVLSHLFSQLEKMKIVLHYAKTQSTTELRKLLSQRGSEGWTTLGFMFSMAVEAECAKVILKYAKDLWENDVDEDGNTLIHLLCLMGHVAVVDLLLKEDEKKCYAVTRKTNKIEQSCLHHACYNGNDTIVQLLVQKVLDLISQTDKNGMTPFHAACLGGHLQVAERLYQQDPNVLSKVDNKENNALHFAALSGNLDLVKWVFTNNKHLLHLENNQNENCFHTACINGSLESAKWLLEQDAAFLWKVSQDGMNALLLASVNGQLSIIKWIIEIDHNLLWTTSSRGWNCLHVACGMNKLSVVKYLVSIKPKLIHAVDPNGITVFAIAGIKGHAEMVDFLIQKKPEFLTIDSDIITDLKASNLQLYNRIMTRLLLLVLRDILLYMETQRAR